MAYKPKTLIVPEGGTGIVTATAYSPICGGTTSTGALQSLASAGTAGQALTSNGAGALPSYQAISGSKLLSFTMAGSSTSPVNDTTTYYISNGQSLLTGRHSFIVFPTSGTITKAYGMVTVRGTLASAGNSTVFIELNGGGTTNITTTLAMSSANNSFSNTGLSIAVSAGDYIRIGLTTPAWATNPTLIIPYLTLLVT